MARDSRKTTSSSPLEFSAPNYVFTVISSWLLPGAGYWILGQRGRAVLFGALILGLFWMGQYLAGFNAVSREQHPYFFVGQAGNGLSTLFSEYSVSVGQKPRSSYHSGMSRVSRDLTQHYATGINFTTISGLLNILLLLHLADPRTWRGQNREDEDPAQEQGKLPGPRGGGAVT